MYYVLRINKCIILWRVKYQLWRCQLCVLTSSVLIKLFACYLISSGLTPAYDNRQRLVKWQFHAVTVKELMNYVAPDKEIARTIQQNQAYTDHQACFIPKDFREKEPHCIICSMEESVWRKVIEKKTTTREDPVRDGRNFWRCVPIQIDK